MKMLSMNLANGAVTEYENFPFVSFASVGGRTFAAGADGLFELTGTTDDGEAIAALVRLGKLDLGGTQQKRVTTAYVEATSEAALALHVFTEEGDDHAYPMGNTAETLAVHRALLGRGIRSKRLQIGLGNPGGGAFAVASVAVLVESGSRRV